MFCRMHELGRLLLLIASCLVAAAAAVPLEASAAMVPRCATVKPKPLAPRAKWENVDAHERRKAANTKAAARQEEKIEEEAKRERLEALEREEVALDEREEALTARDEADRLAKEAAAAKAARKNGQKTTA